MALEGEQGGHSWGGHPHLMAAPQATSSGRAGGAVPAPGRHPGAAFTTCNGKALQHLHRSHLRDQG